MYFYLDKNCFFIPGKCKGVLYDTLCSDIYWLEKDETDLLKISESGEKIDNLDQTFFNELKNSKLGFFSENKCFVEKNRVYNTYHFALSDLFPLQIDSLYIKLNNTCNGNCTCCNKMHCPICTCTNNENGEIPYEKWIEVIDYLSKIKLSNVYFTGGDPLLYKDLIKLINHVNNKGLTPILITNGLNELPKALPLNTSIILTLYENRDLSFILPKFYNFEKVTVLSSDEITVVEIEDMCRDNIIPYKINIDNFIAGKEELKPITLEKIYRKKDLDICLISKLYIDNLGNIVPCYSGIKEKLGNIVFGNKPEVLKTLVENIWCKPKVNNKCFGCEFYFSCPACRYYDSKNNCKYDVSQGEWQL